MACSLYKAAEQIRKPYQNNYKMSPRQRQGTIQLQQSMLGAKETGQVGGMQPHCHGDMIHTPV